MRIFRWFLFVGLLCSLVNPVSASFQDVGESDVNYEAINFLKREGIIGGYPDGTFKPDQTLNRAELTKIVVESSDVDKSKDESCFPDLEKGSWYASYVCTAYELGVVEGYPDGTFKPDQKINRAEAVKIILEAEGIELEEGKSYSDIEVGQWYKKYVDTAYELNYLPYLSLFEPGEYVLRRNFSEIYFRAITSREVEGKVFEHEFEIGEPYYKDITVGNVELYQSIPSYVLMNEVYYFEGKVVDGNASLSLEGDSVFLGSADEEFSMPVWFGSKGVYRINIAGESFDIQVVDDVDVIEGEDLSGEFFDGVHVDTYGNDVVIGLKGMKGYLKKYEFGFDDENLVLLNRQSLDNLVIPNDWLSDIWKGEETVKIIESVSVFNEDERERGEFYEVDDEDFPVVEEFEIIFNNIDNNNIDYSFSDDDPVEISFDALVEPNKYLYVIRESGEVDVVEDVVSVDNDKVSMSYSPEVGALYEIIEINDVSGRALVNYPVYRAGVLPIGGDPYDTSGVSIEANIENALELLNADRAEFGLSELELNEDLNKLAQAHANDMAENKYVSHTDLDGRRASDRKFDFNIVTLVGENIARNRELAAAQSSLMRSAAHRLNILDTDWTDVGLGIAFDENGALYLVQNFSFDSSVGIESLKNRIESVLGVQENVDLKEIAEDWSRVMVDAQSFGVDINGANLNDQVIGYEYLLPATAYTGVFSLISEIDEYLEESLVGVLGQGFSSYGFDVRLGDDGQLYFVLIVGS